MCGARGIKFPSGQCTPGQAVGSLIRTPAMPPLSREIQCAKPTGCWQRPWRLNSMKFATKTQPRSRAPFSHLRRPRPKRRSPVERSPRQVSALGASRAQMDRGLSVEDLHNRLRRQDVELRLKRTKLRETIDRLSLGLRQTLILDPADSDWLIRPLVDWQATAQVADADYAVSVGLANRAQLRLLRTIISEIDQASLPVAGQLLATIHPLVGIMAPSASHFALAAVVITAKLHSTEPEAVSKFRDQVRGILAWRERAIESEIRDAVLGLRHHVHEVSIARDKYTLRADELNRLMAKADRGLTTNLELSTARLELFEAESQWIDEVTELWLLQIRLEQAQGLLATSAPTSIPSPELPEH